MSLFHKRSDFPEPPVPPTYQGGSIALGGSPEDRAMRVSAVWGCVRLLCDSVAMMPVRAFNIKNGVRVPMKSPPQLLQNPASYGTFSDWVYQIMASLLLTGNAYGIVVARDSNLYPIQIELQPINRVTMQRIKGRWVYCVGGTEYPNQADIFHVAAFLMPGSPVGLSPIAYSAMTLGTLAGAENFGRQWFANGSHPSAVLTTPGQINKTQAEIIKQRMKDAVKDNDFAVLGGGVTWQQMQISPEESQFLETQKFGINQIARIFGVPPEMIGGDAGNAMTYANVTQRAMDFLTYSVQPWITRLEAAFAALLPAAQHLRFDTDELVRLDPETQWIVNQAKINTAYSSVNDLRGKAGEPPVEWGHVPYMPGIKNASAGMAIRFGEDPGSGKPDPKAVPAPVSPAAPAAPAADNAPADEPGPNDSKDDSK